MACPIRQHYGITFCPDINAAGGFSPGVRPGTGKGLIGGVTGFIPLIDPALGSAEEVAADDQGNVFAGFTAVGKMALRKFVKN
jgi:hypothetical protein